MKVIINHNNTQEQAQGLITYLQRHGFSVLGFLAVTDIVGHVGKYLLSPLNLPYIKSIDFGGENFYVELPVDHEWLFAQHSIDDEGLITDNLDHYDTAINLAEDKVLVRITNQNYRELSEYFDFTEGQENVFANAKYTAHYNEYYQSDAVDPVE